MARRRKLHRDASSLVLEAPFVMAMRIHEMQVATLTGSAQNTAEMTRMVSEKLAAGAESMLAVNLALSRAMFGAFLTAASPMTPKAALAAGETMAAAALKPYASRVRRNARRLAAAKG